MLSDTALLNKELVMEVLGRGHSRVPVYRCEGEELTLGLVL
jgi:hypothetical protein